MTMHVRFAFTGLLAAFLALSAAFMVSTGAAQDADLRQVLEELNRIRGDLTDVQRYVYRGATVPAVGAAGPVAAGTLTPDQAARLEVRIGQIEDEMRALTGTVEEVAHGIAQVVDRLDRLVADVDFRFTAIEQAQFQGAAPAGAAGGAAVGLSQPTRATEPGTLGTVPFSALGADATSPTGPTATETAALVPALPAGTPQEQYKYAYDLLRQMEYDEAERALKAFIKANPDHNLTGNAYYWLAETYYVRGDYEEAVALFARGYQDFAGSAKAPVNLLKLAMSLAKLGRKEDACITFQELGTRFPNASSAIKQRAVTESRRAGCG